MATLRSASTVQESSNSALEELDRFPISDHVLRELLPVLNEAEADLMEQLFANILANVVGPGKEWKVIECNIRLALRATLHRETELPLESLDVDRWGSKAAMLANEFHLAENCVVNLGQLILMAALPMSVTTFFTALNAHSVLGDRLA